MAERYTYADVIIDPKDKRLEIGKEYFCDTFPFDVLEEANEDSCTSILTNVIEDSYEPFEFEDGYCWSCIIRKKEHEKKYVPFDLNKEEDRNKLRLKWVRSKVTNPTVDYLIIGMSNTTIQFGDHFRNTQELLDYYEFIDGSPCGKLAEVNE